MRTKAVKTGARKAMLGLIGAVALLAIAAPAAALGAPVLQLSSTHLPSEVPVGTSALYKIGVSNSGDSATTENVTVNFEAPEGLEVTKVSMEKLSGGYHAWACDIPDSQSASCVGPELSEAELGEDYPMPIGPGEGACEAEFGEPCRIEVMVTAKPDTPIGTMQPTISACGGGATLCPTTAATAPDDPLEVVPFDLRLTKVDVANTEQGGEEATQAGSRPYVNTTEFFLNSFLGTNGHEYTTEDLKDATASLSPGFVGNPQALPTCIQSQVSQAGVGCPPDSQVGTVELWFDGGTVLPGEIASSGKIPVYNMKVPFGLPGLLAFYYTGNVTQIYASVRNDGDYGLDITAKNAPEALPIAGTTFDIWGVPADPSHDDLRYGSGCLKGCASTAEVRPFLSLPTSCTGPVQTSFHVTGWLGGETDGAFTGPGNDGCNTLDFSPTLEARPTTNVADSPSGLDATLHIPQHEACDPGPPVSCETAEAHLRDAVVTLPEGLVINPAGANGLDGCSPAEVDLHGKGAAHCPDASKQGTVQVHTPLLDHPLNGGVYLADPYNNPFNSLLAIYIAVDDPQTGLVVKLAGEVKADPVTGQLTTIFKDNPQLPFEDFELHFFGGAGAALRTPAACGTYTTTSSLTPWSAPDSGPPATPSDPWAITQAPGGGICPSSLAELPNSPDLDAGTISPIAGTHSPLVINLRRNDGSQEFSAVNLNPPKGLIARLAGTPPCPEAALVAATQKSGQQEKASPSCPAASQIGSVFVGAGAGPAQIHTSGRLYLAGPYKGAPLSLAFLTPATAGPFDLGTVLDRTAVHIDPESGRITAVSDPIPSILQGIPLDVRSIQIKVDKPQFTLNPTSCDPLAFSGELFSTLGKVAPLFERFQVAECGRLAFKPKLALRLSGGTNRGAHPALRAVLQMPPGGANIASTSVALPRSEFLDQAHIGTVCTRVQFAADACPAASIYGHAVATSPLVDYAVEGPIYMRSSNNKLPDLVLALKGPPSQPVEVDAVGRVDSIKGGIRTTFESVPDLPIGRVVLSMDGGKKGLLQNSTNICKGENRAKGKFIAQNGKVASLEPELKAKCAKAKRKGKGKSGRSAAR